MNTFRTFAELNGKLLEYDDHVIFEHDGSNAGGKPFFIELNVGRTRLYEINGNNEIENEIFTLLGLDPWKFCKQHYDKLLEDWEYWKTGDPNLWPPYCCDDFESATKAVLELFAKIEKIEELAETSEILFID